MFIFSKLLWFIIFWANLVPKSEVHQTELNLVQGYISLCLLCLYAICYMLYAKCLYDLAYMLYAHGEKEDIQEKQPNRITKKVEYPEKNKVNE